MDDWMYGNLGTTECAIYRQSVLDIHFIPTQGGGGSPDFIPRLLDAWGPPREKVCSRGAGLPVCPAPAVQRYKGVDLW